MTEWRRDGRFRFEGRGAAGKLATPIPPNWATFTLQEVLEATGGARVGGPESTSIRGVGTDTREDLSNKAFVALSGENFDGHAYLDKAQASGAAILIATDFAQLSERGEGVTLVQVADTLVALGKLAEHHRKRWGKKLVAVVGSAGKTTTRSVISSLMEEVAPGAVHSTQGNLNNRIGVPMVLLGLREEHEYAVVELGTNCPGEVDALGAMTAPHVAVLTLIDLEHTEGLGDLDGVEREESAVFLHLQPEGAAVGFGEDERVLRCLERSGAHVISYGFASGRQLRITERQLVTEQLSRVTLRRAGGEELTITSPLVGRPGALAVAAGVAAVEALTGVVLKDADCERALSKAGEPGRNQIIALSGGRFVIDDTYNSNPASVENSVSTGRELAERSGGKLWLVLGEMLELGALSGQSHEQMGRLAASSGAAGAFFVQGDARRAAQVAESEMAVCRYFDDAEAVSAELAPLVEPGDVVVVKASRGVRAERVVHGLQAFYKPGAPAGLASAGEGGSTP